MATTISYAQAAKGLSSGPTSSATPSKPPSGSATPAKETLASTTAAAAVMSWADDAEANDTRSEKTSSSCEPRTQPQVAAQKAPPASQASTTSLVSSPDLGASSASTVAKDDDVSSIPNTSSDSTWENKSQASTSVEKSVDSVEKMSENASEKAAGKSSEKTKRNNAERAPAKPLQEAPIPVVNIWKQRAESAKAKPKLSPAKPAAPTHGAPQSSMSTAKQAMAAVTTVTGEPKEKASASEGGAGGRGEEKVSQARKDSKPEADFDKARRMTKGRPQEKETQSAPASFPLLSNRDREAWPTPETALDEDRKKAHDKPEKERKDSPASKPSGKKEWVNMAITPNVIFNTPLPNAAGSRRGGRGAARGGTHSGGRAGGFSANNVGHAEKDGSAPASIPNGDQPKRGRPDGFVREASPKEKRTVSAGSLPPKEKPATVNGEKPLKVTTSEAEAPSRRTSIIPESNGQVQGQNSTYLRQYAPRAGKGRRSDFVSQDRRKDSESVSPTKENGVHHERRTSNVTQTDAPEDGERRASNLTDGQPPHQSKRGSNDRQFGSFSRGDRNHRGGTRGGRSNYQNGHQYANGHLPSLKNSSTYSGPLSPTSFNPDPNAYFAPPPGRFRNGPRSQSVTESMYRVPGQYGGPQQVPPIQTYVNGMYDFPMVQPMSAVPYGSYGMDHHTLFSMVSTQLEYYFSLENLLKDMYLRKQMDSKGFVFFSVIAGFNRIKQLTTDPDLIKLVCYQSSNIEFRIGNDGKERLRLQEGWEQWVLPMAQRDPLAQNDGPEEVYNPPIPHPPGFDQSALPRYPEMPAGSPTGAAPFDNQGLYPAVNGFRPGAPQHITMQPNDNLTNGETAEGVNGTATPNGHPVDISTKAVSGEPDSFSDEQVESLTVVVRKQDQSQLPALPLSVTRTFSNASLDSRSGAPDEPEKLAGRQASVRANGTGPSVGDESKVQDQPRRNPSPSVPTSASNPVRLYWVKDNDAPVDFVPPDSTHESYYLLRSKALQQRQNTSPGCCPYDMDVLYQFWSHFLIRNFNTRMYDEFRHFAFDDAANNLSEVGLTNLIKFYGESLLSSQNIIRERVAQDYVDLVQSENKHRRLAFYQLQSAFRNSALEPRNRNRISDLLDAELRTSLE